MRKTQTAPLEIAVAREVWYVTIARCAANDVNSTKVLVLFRAFGE